MLRAEAFETLLRLLRHVKPARVLSDSLHRLAQKHSHRPPDFLSGQYDHGDGKRLHRVDYTQEAGSVDGFVARSMEGTRMSKYVMFDELAGGAGCAGG